MRVPRRTLIIVGLLMIVGLIARLMPGPRTIDDAFITFRYSANLLDGLGFVYNPGVFTLGTTTPLWAFLMAGLGAVTGGRDFPFYALVVSAIADAVSVAGIFFITRRLTGNTGVACIPAAAWAVSPMSVTFAIGGMETSLVVLFSTVAFALYLHRDLATARGQRRIDLALGVLAGLALLTRVDSALWIAPLFLVHWVTIWRERRDRPLIARLPYRTWVTTALIVLPFMLAAWVYFGSPIPNSVTAKRDAYVLEPDAALVRMIQAYSTPFFEFDTFGSAGALAGAFVYLALFIVAVFGIVRRPGVSLIVRLGGLALFVYPVIYFAAFSTLITLVFRWYMAPPLPAWIIAAVVGLWTLLRPLAERPTLVLRGLGYGVLSIAAAVWLFTSVNAWTTRPDHGADRPAPRMAWHAIELLYADMGRYLRDERGVTSATRVAAGDIGAVGFYTGATIVDTIGLVTPENTRYYPVDPALIVAGQNYAIPPQLIRDAQPDYLVTMEGFVRQGLAVDPWFIGAYTLILEYPTGFYGRSMQLWQRNMTTP